MFYPLKNHKGGHHLLTLPRFNLFYLYFSSISHLIACTNNLFCNDLPYNLPFYRHLNTHPIINPSTKKFPKGQHPAHKNKSWNLLWNPTFGNFWSFSRITLERCFPAKFSDCHSSYFKAILSTPFFILLLFGTVLKSRIFLSWTEKHENYLDWF